MDILVIMFAGVLAGRFAVPESFRSMNGALQNVCTCLLIGTMGVSMGAAEGFVSSLGSWGLQGLVFCLVPTACSVMLVHLLAGFVLGDTGCRPHAGAVSEPGAAQAQASRAPRFHLDGLAVAALAMLAVGGAVGVLAQGSSLVAVLASASDPVLWALMFLVGIGVGMHRWLMASIREHHIKMLVIPIGVVVGSLVGGAVAALLLGYGPRAGMAVASGLGWYSLAGISIERLAGAQLGAIAFLANFLRELVSFFCIPWIARHLSGYACIAAGGATSEDTTLPMVMRYTDERCVVYSVVNGVVCSAVVPVLITLILG